VAVATETKRRWSVEARTRNIHVLNLTLDRVKDEQRVLLMSDVHWDNPHCDRALLKRHMDEALAHNAPILDAGDWWCAMQGRFDPRSSKNDLRPEHQRGDYLDALVRTSAEWLQPYQHLLTVRGFGNHETAILKRHETHLTERLVERLKAQGADQVALGGYSGWVVFRVKYAGTRQRAFKMHYHHGYGGGGPVTRGVIQTSRQAVYLPDADLVWNGHTHDAWQMPIARVRLNQSCTEVEHVRQVHIRTAGYKQEYADGYGGWHIERGGPPKPLGAAWLIFRQVAHDTVDCDVIEAK
jgi:hypothetical protein